MKEIVFFTYGDSADVSTWSNVPYLFTKTLEDKGIKIDRVNLNDTPCYKMLNRGGRLLRRLLSFIYPNNEFTYMRSSLFRWMTFRLIKKKVQEYATADLCIVTNFEFYNKFTNIPTLLFCDWTYEILILDRLNRKPYFFETKYPEFQREAINNAEYVVSLFPVCADIMRQRYPKANIHYLGGNVINSLYDRPLDENEIIGYKQSHKDILFIGGKKYKEGAELLIMAVEKLHTTIHNIEVNIIGMTREDFKQVPDYVHCHGYLHKDNPYECKLYYELMTHACVIVNPSERWAGYSSTIEAMYFYTPIVVSPYKDFVEEFGRDINFGAYNSHFDSDTLAETIKVVIDNPRYADMCRYAHERVKDYTWDRYVDKILELVKN